MDIMVGKGREEAVEASSPPKRGPSKAIIREPAGPQVQANLQVQARFPAGEGDDWPRPTVREDGTAGTSGRRPEQGSREEGFPCCPGDPKDLLPHPLRGGQGASGAEGTGTGTAPGGTGRAVPVQPPLDLYMSGTGASKVDNIYPGDARRVLNRISSLGEKYGRAVLFFDNDLDGFSSAVFLREMLWNMGIEIPMRNIIPITHLHLNSIRHEPDVLYFYVDMQPKEWGDMVFCVDHHTMGEENRFLSGNAVVFAPADIERHFPTTALILVMYLKYVQEGGNLDFISYVTDKVWDSDRFSRMMVLLDSVSDNLWMLSKHSKVGLLRRWIDDSGLDETELIKVSIAASLIIGEQDEDIRGLEVFFDTPFHRLGERDIMDTFNRVRSSVEHLFTFASGVDSLTDEVVRRRNAELDEEIARCQHRVDLDTETLEQLIESMPAHVKRDKDALLELLTTVGDKTNPRWKQVEFYATEVPRLSKVIQGNQRRLDMLKEKKRMVFPEVINGVCVFIGPQRSNQVKGILSSLLYYLGRRNLIIEEGEHASVWGARGFSKDFLAKELTTLQVDRHQLGVQTQMDDLGPQVPKSFKHVLNITRNITIQHQYVGGMGGRGLIYGGNILGRVPKLFATIDDEVMQRKLKELIDSGELAKAVRGLTEGQDLVPTAQALRAKFKARGWITFQAIGTGGSGDILAGDVGSPLVWLAGKGIQVTMNGNGARMPAA